MKASSSQPSSPPKTSAKKQGVIKWTVRPLEEVSLHFEIPPQITASEGILFS